MEVVVYKNSKEVSDDVIIPKLCHRDKIIEIISGDENIEDCDALITRNKNIKLGIKTADCAPVCFSDGEKIGIAHIGWRGLCLSLIEKMVSNFNIENLEVFVGPCMHSFEIQRDFCFDMIKEKFGEKFFIENDGKITFLFKDAIMSVLPINVRFDARNTFEDTSLPSFRRDKTTERLVTVVSFK